MERLRTLMGQFPAVAVLGPRQAGKTTLALALLAGKMGSRAVYLDLELPSARAKLSDAELYCSTHENQILILDEIQRMPGIFQILRGVIDQRRRKGRRFGQFLLLGSASIDLLQQSAETLAGRIAYVDLTPLTLAELPPQRPRLVNRLWVRGGFPDSYLAGSDTASLQWRQSFIQTYLERDVPMLGPRIPAETLYRFWQMLAHNQGQTINLSRLAAGLAVSGQTVARYLDVLVDLLLVRRLTALRANTTKRLIQSPKVYVRDSGLVHALLGIAGFDPLLGHPVVGSSWEGFVIENLIATAPPGTRPFYYRTADGAEIDLLLELRPGKIWAVEVKRSISDPRPAKGFYLACDDLKVARRFVVYPGEERYQLDKKTEVVPAQDALKGALTSRGAA